MAYIYSGTFEIIAPPSITVDTPSAAPYYVTDTINITWSTTGTVGNVKIMLYKSSSLITTLSSSTANDGSFNWTIKTSELSGSSNYYRIKIQETDGDPSDFSSYFRINHHRLEALTEATLFTENFSKDITQYKTLKTATDVTSFSESTSYSTQLYKYLKTASETTSFTESLTFYVQVQPTPIDNMNITEAISESKRSWKILYGTNDSTAITETLTTFIHKQPEVLDVSSLTESISASKSQWQRAITDASTFSENFDYNLGFNYTLTDTPGITESIASTKTFWKHLYGPTDTSAITESLSTDIHIFKKLKTASDTTQFSVDSVSHSIGSWENNLSTDQTSLTESLSTDTRTWKHLLDSLDYTSTTETVVKSTRVWKHPVTATDTTDFTHAVTTETKPWKRFATDETATTETVSHTISQWAYAINDVLAFTEDVSDIYGEAAIDRVAFVESVATAIFRSCDVRKFENSNTESFSTLRKSGWLPSKDQSGSGSMIRRLNVEYNSADPLDFRIYVDGDESNSVFTTTFPAATGEETTNKSVRVGTRAKNFMLEISTPESTNTNVNIEDIEVEIDDGKV